MDMMNTAEAFRILGTEPVKDEKQIKNAYREKLTVTNPEDDPEGFKRLRQAYEEACRYAKSQEPQEQEAAQADETPSGMWVAKAEDIYRNIHRRCSLEEWNALFQEDVFLFLEEEENCRLKLIRFLMEHYKLPTQIWRLMDQKLSIAADIHRLKEYFPAEFLSFVASKCERGEDVEFTQFEGEAEAPYDLFLQYYDRCWQALQAEELEQAGELLESADRLQIYHPIMEINRATLLVKSERQEEAFALMEQLLERYPKDALIVYNAAELYWSRERKEKAASLYRELKQENDSHYMANVRLCAWYYEQREYRIAKNCAEKVLSFGVDDTFMELLANINRELEKDLEMQYRLRGECETGLELCWCYLQDGKICRGLRMARSLRDRILPDRDVEYKGLMAKLCVEETEYEAAVEWAEKWEQALLDKIAGKEQGEDTEKDRDRIRQSHLIRVQCYRGMGYTEHEEGRESAAAYNRLAVKELEGLETGSSKDIGILLEKAQVYLQLEEYEKSLEICERLIEDYQIYAAAATSQEVHRRQWNAQGVVADGRICIRHFPGYIRAYEHVANVYLDLERYEDLKQLLGEAAKNGINSVILEAYQYRMNHEVPSKEEFDKRKWEYRKNILPLVEEGCQGWYEKYLPGITELLYWYPSAGMLVERGIYHRAGHHLQEAVKDFEKALAEKPGNPHALRELSLVLKYRGEYDKALICLKKAIRYWEGKVPAGIYMEMGNLYSLLRDNENALEIYRSRKTESAAASDYYMTRLTTVLLDGGKWQEAVSQIQTVYKEDSCRRFEQMVRCLQEAGQLETARRELGRWRRRAMPGLCEFCAVASPAVPRYYSRLAWQELLEGQPDKAVKAFEREARNRKSSGREGAYCDLLFLCALYGEEQTGRKYGAQLKEWLEHYRREKENTYYNREKELLRYEFFAAYFTEPEEVLWRLLEREPQCEICRHCIKCVCEKLDGARMVLLLRQNRQEELQDLLKRKEEQHPCDLYLRAVQVYRRKGEKGL